MFKSLPLEQMELMADSCFLLLKKSLGDALKKNHINVICSQTSKNENIGQGMWLGRPYIVWELANEKL